MQSIERQMRDRALQLVREADFVIAVQAVNELYRPLDLPAPADLVVLSKADLASQPLTLADSQLAVSIVTGDGLAALRDRLDQLAFGRAGSETRLALNVRHIQAISHAGEALERAATIAAEAADRFGGWTGAELCAAELREALLSLGQVLGQVSPDDVLGRIFSRFCIGK
jgi:tRNA modification GTPase